jgi:hypothetical protein
MSNGNGILAGLRKRAELLDAKIAAQEKRVRNQEARDKQRLFKTVGEICCKAAQRRPDFGAALKEVLYTEADAKARRFLTEKGMI